MVSLYRFIDSLLIFFVALCSRRCTYRQHHKYLWGYGANVSCGHFDFLLSCTAAIEDYRFSQAVLLATQFQKKFKGHAEIQTASALKVRVPPSQRHCNCSRSFIFWSFWLNWSNSSQVPRYLTECTEFTSLVPCTGSSTDQNGEVRWGASYDRRTQGTTWLGCRMPHGKGKICAHCHSNYKCWFISLPAKWTYRHWQHVVANWEASMRFLHSTKSLMRCNQMMKSVHRNTSWRLFAWSSTSGNNRCYR